QDSIQKYRLRYIVGKLAQYVNEQAYGDSEADLAKFVRASDLEHILPQSLSAEIVEAFDKPADIDSYMRRLGNLTLLEGSINRSVSNNDFDKKREAYRKSHYLLTRTIV